MEQKNWLDSSTVRGALMASMPGALLVLKCLHVQVGPAEAQTIIDGVAGVFSAAGAVFAIWGRFQAHDSQIVMGKPNV